jgi:hypothetical protein
MENMMVWGIILRDPSKNRAALDAALKPFEKQFTLQSEVYFPEKDVTVFAFTFSETRDYCYALFDSLKELNISIHDYSIFPNDAKEYFFEGPAWIRAEREKKEAEFAARKLSKEKKVEKSSRNSEPNNAEKSIIAVYGIVLQDPKNLMELFNDYFEDGRGDLVQDYKVIPFDDRNIAVIITILKGDEKEIDNFTGDLGTMKGIIIKAAVEMK